MIICTGGGRESRDEQTVKSEISEESGYFSLKQDEDNNVVNLSVHDHHKQQQLQHRRYTEEGEFRRSRNEHRSSADAAAERRRHEERSRSGGGGGSSRERGWGEEAGEGRRARSSDSQSMVRADIINKRKDRHTVPVVFYWRIAARCWQRYYS